AKAIQEKNVYPHRLSRGGYQLLERKLIEEKRKASQEASQSDPSCVTSPPSPPSRHEKWKKARQSKKGDYTTVESRIVGQKI
ncbi:unnamed protein product, partial [Sphenostylis stenocarpa]